MKLSLFVVLLLAATASCPAQNKTPMNYPNVSESLEKIDSEVVSDEQASRAITMPDGSVMQYTKVAAGYSLRIFDPRLPFAVVKNYYPDGFIKEKGVSISNNACPLGNWYFFTKEHRLEKKTDFDAGYKFDIGDVFKYLVANKIPEPPRRPTKGGKHTEIYKGTENGTPVYYIHWLKKPELVEIHTISGTNGRLLNKIQEPYSNS